MIDQLVWLRHESGGERTRLRRHGRARVAVQRRRREGRSTSLTSKLSGFDAGCERRRRSSRGASDERGALLKATPEVILQDALGELYWASADLGTDVDAAVWEGVTYRGGGVL